MSAEQEEEGRRDVQYKGGWFCWWGEGGVHRLAAPAVQPRVSQWATVLNSLGPRTETVVITATESEAADWPGPSKCRSDERPHVRELLQVP